MNRYNHIIYPNCNNSHLSANVYLKVLFVERFRRNIFSSALGVGLGVGVGLATRPGVTTPGLVHRSEFSHRVSQWLYDIDWLTHECTYNRYVVL